MLFLSVYKAGSTFGCEFTQCRKLVNIGWKRASEKFATIAEVDGFDLICQVNHDISSGVALSNDEYGHPLEDLWFSVNVAVNDFSRKSMKSRYIRDERLKEMPA